MGIGNLCKPPGMVLYRSQNPERKHQQCPDKFEQCFHGNTNKAEGQHQQPDDRVEEKEDQGQWPANNQKYDPEQKSCK